MELSILSEINPGRGMGGRPNPHKFALLLAVADLFAENPERDNTIELDSMLELSFETHFRNLAPDLQFTPSMIEAPFYHLEKSLWSLHIRPGLEQEHDNVVNNLNARFTRKRIRDIFSHASISPDLEELFRDSSSRQVASNHIKDMYFRLIDRIEVSQLRSIELSGSETFECNPFVSYLNSLQRSGGSNENALAESQACNSYFSSIHVGHPISETITRELADLNGDHVILTGHAGDGKSTIALEVYKHFRGVNAYEPIDTPMSPSETIGGITVVKDLSERNKSDDKKLLKSIQSRKSRYLLVSNTGTLLDLLKGHADFFGSDPAAMESKVLEAISSESGEDLLLIGDLRFRVFNLALIDNLDIARRVFELMLAQERWEHCSQMECSRSCPIYLNVHLVQQHQKLVLDRVFLAYRRMYEYGTRLTMRQFTEHLAYMLTSGMQHSDIQKTAKKGSPSLLSEYLLFNRFFGDNGYMEDESAAQMKAVIEIKRQGFGDRPLPGWEHRLWLRYCSSPVRLEIDTLELSDEFELLRLHGAHIGYLQGVTRNQAREQVRRMLYFLHRFSQDDSSYLTQYLNSPTLISWMSWQQPDAKLVFPVRTSLDKQVFHVLQEHFTGVRIPETSNQSDRRLYVTLNQRNGEVRQSAQIVLAQVDWESSMELVLSEITSASGGIRRDLELRGKESISSVSLPLRLPFLDYVMMRHFGELGEVLDPSYRNRIDRFKAQILALVSEDDSTGITLVRLRTGNTFRRQFISIQQSGLEVRDA